MQAAARGRITRQATRRQLRDSHIVMMMLALESEQVTELPSYRAPSYLATERTTCMVMMMMALGSDQVAPLL